MRWKVVLGLCALMTSLAAPASTQERLGDVAGSITLNKSGADNVVIESQPSTNPGRPFDSRSDGSALKQVVEDALARSRELLALVGELHTPGVFTDLDWRSRMDEANLRLDMVQQDLLVVRHGGRYEDAYALAEQGMNLAMQSSTTLREGIARNQLGIKEPIAQLEESDRLLEGALRSVEAVLRAEKWEVAAAPIDPVSAAALIGEFCGGKYAEGSQQHADCVSRQDAAYRSGLNRNPFSVGLQEAEFNTIRNACRYEWPKDLGSQNRCESERMARQARQ